MELRYRDEEFMRTLISHQHHHLCQPRPHHSYASRDIRRDVPSRVSILWLIFTLSISLCMACEEAPSTSVECELNSDCPLPERCIMNTCRVECLEDRDCAFDETCQAGRCLSTDSIDPPLSNLSDMTLPPDTLMSCQTDMECLSGSTCIQGSCQATEGVCAQNSDCPSGQLCSRDTYRCIPSDAPQTCEDLGDCFAGERCIEGICTPEDQICAAGDCPMSCGADSDCERGEICEGGRCEAGCTSDQECPDELLCRMGRCAPECVYNSDFTSPLICQEGQCIPECVDDRGRIDT